MKVDGEKERCCHDPGSLPSRHMIDHLTMTTSSPKIYLPLICLHPKFSKQMIIFEYFGLYILWHKTSKMKHCHLTTPLSCVQEYHKCLDDLKGYHIAPLKLLYLTCEVQECTVEILCLTVSKLRLMLILR